MPWAVDHLLGGADLDDATEVHHADPIAHTGDHPQIVGDEEIGDVPLALEAGQEVQDVGLDRDIERRNDFIAQQQLGIDRQGPSDIDPLPLASRELVGSSVRHRRRQPDGPERGVDRFGQVSSFTPAQDPYRLLDALAYGHPGIERIVRVLEDHLHPTPMTPQPFSRKTVEPGAAQRHRAGDLDPVAPQQLGDRPGHGRFAGARFADQAQCFPRRDVETDLRYGVNDSSAGPASPKSNGQLLDFENRRRCSLSGHFRAAC